MDNLDDQRQSNQDKRQEPCDLDHRIAPRLRQQLILLAFPYLAHGYLTRRALMVPLAVALPLNDPIACSHTVVVAVTL